MSDTNPLFDKKVIQAGDASMRLVLMETKDSYLVEIVFPLDSFRVYCSKWANPLRTALEAADEAINALKCEIYSTELNSGKLMTKKPEEAQQDEIIAIAKSKAEEKEDG